MAMTPEPQPCRKCGGKGQVAVTKEPPGKEPVMTTCPLCRGTGKAKPGYQTK